jgi:hypothetical protein
MVPGFTISGQATFDGQQRPTPNFHGQNPSRIRPQMSKSHYLSTWKEHHFSWLDHSDSMAKFPCFYGEMSLQKPTSFTQGFPTQVTMFVGQIPFNLHSCWVRCIESSMFLSVYWYLPFFCFEDSCWQITVLVKSHEKLQTVSSDSSMKNHLPEMCLKNPHVWSQFWCLKSPSTPIFSG